MKKIYYLLLSAFLLFSSSATAQVFEGKGDLSVNAGLSLGVIGYGYGGLGSAGFAVPLTANLNYGIHEMFSVGPYLAYMGRSYGSTTLSAFGFGAQGTFHASPFLNENLDLNINEEKVDVYAKLVLGYENYSWSYDGQRDYDWAGDSGGVDFGTVLGVRYMFNEKVGAYAEGGRGTFGLLTLGVSFKL